MMPRLRPYLILTLLWCAYFHPLILHPTQVLYSDYSDFLAEHLPAKVFLTASGARPANSRCGTRITSAARRSFHDIQVGCFYPPYAVMYVVPEARSERHSAG